MKSRFVIFGVPFLIVLVLVISACAGSTEGADQVELTLAPKSVLPDFVPPMV